MIVWSVISRVLVIVSPAIINIVSLLFITHTHTHTHTSLLLLLLLLLLFGIALFRYKFLVNTKTIYIMCRVYGTSLLYILVTNIHF